MMMSPTVIKLVAAGLLLVPALGDGVKQVNDFASMEEIANFANDGLFSASIVNRIFHHVGQDSTNLDYSSSVTVPIKHMATSTPPHVDRYVMRPDAEVVDDIVAFVMMNTNKDAKFVHGNEQVPFQAGSLVSFQGSTAHHTIVNSGHAKIAGPFHVRSMERVGRDPNCEGRSAEACCQGDDACYLCPDDRRRDEELPLSGEVLSSGVTGRYNKSSKSSKSSKGTCNLKCVFEEDKVDGTEAAMNPRCAQCFAQRGFSSFNPGRMLEDVSDSQERLVEIVNDLQGNLDGKFGIIEDLLPSHDRASLRNYADSQLMDAIQAADKEEDTDIQEDFRIEVSPSKLASLIDLNSIQSMHKAFKDYAIDTPVTRVVIRRTTLTGDKHIQYHNDGDSVVMRVDLNEEGTVDGGNLVYLSNDGAVKVPTKPGAAALHGNKIVHGITPLNGTRYILILVGNNKYQSDVLEAIVS